MRMVWHADGHGQIWLLCNSHYTIWNQNVTTSKFQKVNSYLFCSQFLRAPQKRPNAQQCLFNWFLFFSKFWTNSSFLQQFDRKNCLTLSYYITQNTKNASNNLLKCWSFFSVRFKLQWTNIHDNFWGWKY